MATAAPSIQWFISELSKTTTNEAPLRIHFPSITVTSRGTAVNKAAAQELPTLSIKSATVSQSKKYIAISIDPDAPLPEYPISGPILHGIQADLQPIADPYASDSAWVHLKATSKPVAPYIGPNPPPPSTPHRYIFFVFEQPDGLTREKAKEILGLDEEVGLMSRIRWDQRGFETKLGLSEVVAGNWFTSAP